MPKKPRQPRKPKPVYYEDLTDAEKAELEKWIEEDELLKPPPIKHCDRDKLKDDDVPF